MNKAQLPVRPWGHVLQAAVPYKSQIIPWAYAAALIAAELATAASRLQQGLFLHIFLMLALFVQAAASRGQPARQLHMALALAPLIRVLSLTMPLEMVPSSYKLLLVVPPLFVAAVIVARLAEYDERDVGLVAGSLPVQLGIALLGLPLGLMEYLVLKPAPLIPELTFHYAWLPVLILLVSTGFTEELVFRGVLYRSAAACLGRWHSILFVSFIFSIMHLNYQAPLDLAFVFTVSLLFTAIVSFSRSILGVSLAHGFINIGMYILWPHLVPGTNLLTYLP